MQNKRLLIEQVKSPNIFNNKEIFNRDKMINHIKYFVCAFFSIQNIQKQYRKIVTQNI